MTNTTPQASYDAAFAKTAELESLLAAAQADQDALKDAPIEQLIQTPDKAKQIAEARTRAAELVSLHAEMVQAARARQEVAANSLLRHMAAAEQKHIKAAQTALDAWRKEEVRLLDGLREHAGISYARAADPGQQIAAEAPAWVANSVRKLEASPRETALEVAVERATSRQAALNAAADEGEPLEVCRLEWLPEALRPGGIRCSEATLEACRVHDEKAAEEAAAAQRDQEHAEQLAQACKTLGIEPLKLCSWMLRKNWLAGAWFEQNQERVEQAGLTGERAAAVRVVSQMAGPAAANKLIPQEEVKPFTPYGWGHCAPATAQDAFAAQVLGLPGELYGGAL